MAIKKEDKARRRRAERRRDGAVLIMLAFMFPLLLLCVAIGVDGAGMLNLGSAQKRYLQDTVQSYSARHEVIKYSDNPVVDCCRLVMESLLQDGLGAPGTYPAVVTVEYYEMSKQEQADALISSSAASEVDSDQVSYRVGTHRYSVVKTSITQYYQSAFMTRGYLESVGHDGDSGGVKADKNAVDSYATQAARARGNSAYATPKEDLNRIWKKINGGRKMYMDIYPVSNAAVWNTCCYSTKAVWRPGDGDNTDGLGKIESADSFKTKQKGWAKFFIIDGTVWDESLTRPLTSLSSTKEASGLTDDTIKKGSNWFTNYDEHLPRFTIHAPNEVQLGNVYEEKVTYENSKSPSKPFDKLPPWLKNGFANAVHVGGEQLREEYREQLKKIRNETVRQDAI
jgi:hypothetical protein